MTVAGIRARGLLGARLRGETREDALSARGRQEASRRAWAVLQRHRREGLRGEREGGANPDAISFETDLRCELWLVGSEETPLHATVTPQSTRVTPRTQSSTARGAQPEPR